MKCKKYSSGFNTNNLILVTLLILFCEVLKINAININNNRVFVEQINNNNGDSVRVNKCCEKSELYVDKRCTHVNETNTGVWSPIFTNEEGEQNIQVTNYVLVTGVPDCGSTQRWPIFHYPASTDKLVLLPNGRLRHFIDHNSHLEDEDDKIEEPQFYDYQPGKYCLDKMIQTHDGLNLTVLYGLVCSPDVKSQWSDIDFIFKKIVNPVCHAIAIIILLVIAIIYFVLPTLRDLVGNIITTITICLILGQTADLVRIFTEFSNHVNMFVANIIYYASHQSAFFWLSGMGYYIWRTFSSRNVFLRVTDGRKYCWYSGYAWGCTIVMTGIAIFAHYAFDSVSIKKPAGPMEEENLGSLSIYVFFTPVAFSILADVFFYVTTSKIIDRTHTYGRIHHKLKNSFRMFIQLFFALFIPWLFHLLSLTKYDGLVYVNIIVNAMQAPLMLYICVIQQKQVTFLLRKSCCYSEPVPTNDWGDEMTQMNGDCYN